MGALANITKTVVNSTMEDILQAGQRMITIMRQGATMKMAATRDITNTTEAVNENEKKMESLIP